MGRTPSTPQPYIPVYACTPASAEANGGRLEYVFFGRVGTHLYTYTYLHVHPPLVKEYWCIMRDVLDRVSILRERKRSVCVCVHVACCDDRKDSSAVYVWMFYVWVWRLSGRLQSVDMCENLMHHV